MDFKCSSDTGNRNFKYSFQPGSNRPKYQLDLSLSVINKESPEELAARVANYHNIPCFVKSDLASELRDFREKEQIKFQDSHAQAMIEWIQQNPEKIKEVAEVAAEKYENTWSRYTKPTTDKLQDFSQAYHFLIHSSAMMILLELERIYQQIVTKMVENRKQLINNLQEKQEMEMSRACDSVGFAYTPHDVSQIAGRHLEELEKLEKHYKDEYEEVIGDQKKKFREIVQLLADEMKQADNQITADSKSHEKIKLLISDAETQLSNLHLHTTSNDNFSSREDMISSPGIKSSPSESSGGGSLSTIIQMEESFTVNLGNQLKTMHNLRLLVTDIFNFCRYADVREMGAQRFQTVMSLYSDSLSAVILFTDKQLDCSSGIEGDLATICHSSNEFHFDNFPTQLEKLKRLIKQEKNEKRSEENKSLQKQDETFELQDGDLFISRHSNLSQVHVVCHLATDTSSLKSKNSHSTVNSRHPVYHGLRHALKIASDFEIKTITLPLLLSHDVTDDMTSQWCIRRAELVMKWMKEMASWDGGVSRTIQFVVPPGISEDCFDAIRSNLPEVYRTTSTRNLTPQGIKR